MSEVLSLRDALPARPALARALKTVGVSAAQLEASVRSPLRSPLRGDAEGAVSDRMMIERAPATALDHVLVALAIPRVPVFDEMLAAAAAVQVPIIVGWDGTRRCAKLYVNASDTTDAVRAELGKRLGGGAAHVFGVNVFCDGSSEDKRYVQLRETSGLGAEASRLVASAGDLCAGVVSSRDKDGHSHATFVALRPTSPARLDAAFGTLPGFSWKTLCARAPFPPASPRSIGLAASEPARWTAYLKPAVSGEPELFSLEPLARFRAGEDELAIYVTPSADGLPAYASAGESDISYRVLHGRPPRDAITTLLDWVVRQVRNGHDDAFLEEPPSPWRRA